jgi:hypothetical protein
VRTQLVDGFLEDLLQDVRFLRLYSASCCGVYFENYIMFSLGMRYVRVKTGVFF